ncbi:MAG: hypothetical protein P1V51_07160 [Deltaproteobacteria bacterium]|nr:hypothetical protein [Deltaproteobacteria bacterium]
MRRSSPASLICLGALLSLALPARAEEAPAPTPEPAPAPEPAPEPAPPPEPTRPSVSLMNLEAGAGVKQEAAEAATQWIEGWLVHYDVYEITSAEQLRAMIDFEAQKQLLGCIDESCAADFGELLKTDRLLAGKLTRVGSSARLNLALIDTRAGRRLSSATRMVVIETNIEPLLQETAGLVHELLSRDPGVKALPPVPPRRPPPTVKQTAYPTLSDLRKDPRNGFSLGVAAGLQAGAPVFQLALHGQGGAVGMGLELGWLDPKGPMNGILLRPELRIMPIAWRFLAPFVGFAGGIVFFNDATAPNPGRWDEAAGVELPCSTDEGAATPCDRKLYRALLGPRLGVQVAFGHFQALLMASYELEVHVADAFVGGATGTDTESEPDLAKGLGFQLMLGLRL